MSAPPRRVIVAVPAAAVRLESQRDQTHSVLAVMLGAALLCTLIRLTKKQTVFGYALFGLLGALGCLTKYNFAVFLVALPLAALSLKDFRGVFSIAALGGPPSFCGGRPAAH